MRDKFKEFIDTLECEQRLRTIPADIVGSQTDFTSNDYLGIAAEARQEQEFFRKLYGAASLPPLTSSASRLLAGRQREYAELEAYLNHAYGKSCLLFNSGYHANVGCVQALGALDKDVLIVSDKLVHASVIDGIRLSGATYRRFRHNDAVAAERIVERERANYSIIWIIVESIYSMDGDLAPLRELVAIKKKYPCVRLYVDEAHGLGVRGDTGLGLCEELGIIDDVDLLIGTFGKACASVGAFAAADAVVHDYLLNSARSFIFSTALPPINVAYTLHVMKAVRGMRRERERLLSLGWRLRKGLENITGQCNPSSSQIVPWILDGNKRVMMTALQLRERGFMAMPIRRPTVPEGTERIRFSLSAALDERNIDLLLEAIDKIVALHEA